MNRKRIVAGNWKMNLSHDEGYNLAVGIRNIIGNETAGGVRAILCTPYIHLKSVAGVLTGSAIETGAQNCSDKQSGAFTGEVSAQMIKSTGATWVITGHSERRTLFCEDDTLILAKTKAALDAGVSVIFCCGELLPQRQAGMHFETVKTQLMDGLFRLPADKLRNVVVAYEPVWAIGTGVTASPEEAQEMHSYIRDVAREVYGKESANNLTILYGGSCKAANAADLFAGPDVDGGLIGGASLQASEFCSIVRSLEKK